MIYRRSIFRNSFFFLLFLLYLSYPLHLGAEERVSVYDDFDDGAFGQSVYRSVFRCVDLSAFSRSSTLPVRTPAWEQGGLLTAVVLSVEREDALRTGVYGDSVLFYDGVYHYNRDGIEFSFSLEKPTREIMLLIDDYYTGKYASWRDPLEKHYKENFVIRIHSAENIFDPWKNEISYDEVLLMATLLGDRDQWLWGIHNGADLLNR